VLDPDARRRFEHEARAASALDHPNLVTVFDIGDAPDGGIFIAMAYCEGGTLGEALEAGPLPVPQAAALAIQIADGLAAAHRRGIVHRDIKPGNIIVTPAGDARIVDFGIAKVAGSALTQTTLTPGTIAYMSPEQTRGASVDVRADVWALGAVLYEMLAGRRPFRAEDAQVLIHAIRHDEPEPLAQLRPDVPSELLRVIDRCLRKNAEERYPSADALLADLRAPDPESALGGAGRSEHATATPAGAGRASAGIGGESLRWVFGIASVVLAITAMTLARRSPAGAPPLEPRRVAVAPVLNLGGTAELDGVANMADYWITHSLLQTGFIQIVPLGRF
jgi:serine/threonine protein kinase